MSLESSSNGNNISIILKKSLDNKTNTFKQILNDKDVGFYLVLNDIVTTYINYKKYPDNQSYKITMNNTETKLSDIKSEIFLLKNEIENDLDNMNKDIKIFDDEINNISNLNEILKNEYDTLIKSNNASYGRMIEKKEVYRFKLFDIILLSVFIIYILYNLFNIIKEDKLNPLQLPGLQQLPQLNNFRKKMNDINLNKLVPNIKN
jgi:hypothetical protein